MFNTLYSDKKLNKIFVPISSSIFLILSTSLITLPISPLFCFAVSIFGLIVLSEFINKTERLMLSIFAIFSLIFIFASRSYFYELNHDLSRYYYIYQQLSSGNLDFIFFFGGGIEIGWTVFIYLTSIFNKNLTAIDVAIINSILCSILFLLWVEKHGLNTIDPRFKSLVSGLLILFISMPTLGYLQRQALSTVLLLFSFSNRDNYKGYLYLFLATLFHLTAFFIGIILLYLYNKKVNIKSFLLFIFICITIRFSFNHIVNSVSYLTTLGSNQGIIFGLANKFVYYQTADNAIASFRFLILLFPLFISNFFSYKKNIQWAGVIFYFCSVYFIFLGLPLLSERIGFIFFYVYGILIYSTTSKFGSTTITLLRIFSLAYLIFFIFEKLNIFPTPPDPFWFRYQPFDLKPFYYLWVK